MEGIITQRPRTRKKHPDKPQKKGQNPHQTDKKASLTNYIKK